MIIQRPYGPTPNPQNLSRAEQTMVEAITQPMNIRAVMNALKLASPAVVVSLVKKLCSKGFLETIV